LFVSHYARTHARTQLIYTISFVNINIKKKNDDDDDDDDDNTNTNTLN